MLMSLLKVLLTNPIKPKRLLRAPDSTVISQDDGAATLQIAGLFCGVCATRVEDSLAQLDGVETATCDLESARVDVALSRQVSAADLQQAVIDAAAAMPLRRAAERAARSVGL